MWRPGTRPARNEEDVVGITRSRAAAAGALALVLAGAAACGSSSSGGSTSSGSSSSSSSGSSSTPNLTPSSFTLDFSAMSQLKGLASKGKGKIGVILPDTTTSARYTEFDTPYLTKAFETAGLSSSD